MPNAVIRARKPISRDGFFENARGVLLKPLKTGGQHIFLRINTSSDRIVVKLEKSTQPKITNSLKMSILEFCIGLAEETGGEIVHHNLHPSGEFDESLYTRYEITTRRINKSDWINSIVKAKELSVEIGMGRGEFLSHMAKKYPSEHFIGIEISNSDFHTALRRFRKEGISNVSVIYYDAKAVLGNFKPNSLKAVYLNFPEPWFKKKRMKHSILTAKTAKEIESALKPEGRFVILTDNYPFAVSSATILSQLTRLKSSSKHCITINPTPIQTRFERRWIKRNRTIYRLEFVKQAPSEDVAPFKLSFPIPLPENNLITDRYIFKTLNIYRSPEGEAIAEVAVGCSLSPQHVFFRLKENKLQLLPQSNFVVNRDFVEAVRLAHL